jgi:hypothetical protein
MTGGDFESKILEGFVKVGGVGSADEMKAILSGQGASEELIGLAEQAKNGTLAKQLDPVSPAAIAADGVLKTASTMELAMLSGYHPHVANQFAVQQVKETLTQPTTAYLKATQEAGGAPAAMFPDPVVTATQAVVGVDPTAVFNPEETYSAVEEAFSPQIANEVKAELDKIAKEGTSTDELSVEAAVQAEAEATGVDTYQTARTTEESAWLELTLQPGPVREWLNAQVNGLLNAPGSEIVLPTEEDWWTDLPDGTKQDLADEVNRRVKVFSAYRSPRDYDRPITSDVKTVIDRQAKAADTATEVEAALEKEFTKFESTAGPLAAYGALIDQHGVPLHGQIYTSLAMHALPQSMRYMQHVLPAIQRRLPTMKGAWYLSDDFLTASYGIEGETGSLLTGADRFANFVMKGGNPFNVDLTDTTENFKKWVLASRTSREDVKAVYEASDNPTNFLARFALVSPRGSKYDPTVERHILKAKAGWTGIGERGRMREAVLDMIQHMYDRKRLMDPTDTEGLLAFASTIKGSPWYVPPEGKG